jgi:hypothetical protein
MITRVKEMSFNKTKFGPTLAVAGLPPEHDCRKRIFSYSCNKTLENALILISIFLTDQTWIIFKKSKEEKD